MTKTLNTEINLLKAFGIIAVVIAHHQNPYPYFFAATSFHMALFFFASGYFYKPSNEDSPLRYIKKRAVWFFAVFYVYHLYHALELHIMWQSGIPMGWGPPVWPQWIYYPFVTFSSYGLGFSMWFVMQLFVVQIAYMLLRRLFRFLKLSELDYTLLLFGMAVLATGLSVGGYIGYHENYELMVVMRTFFCMFFLHLGHYFRTDVEGRWNIFNSHVLIGVFLVQATCIALFKSLGYTVGSMDFKGHMFLPIVVACTGIYICLYMAKLAAPRIGENHILTRIGKNTFHIAAMHMSFCFIIVLLARYLTASHWPRFRSRIRSIATIRNGSGRSISW